MPYLKRSGALRHLRELDLQHSDVTDAGLAYLRGVKTLQKLDLCFTKLTSEGLRPLRDLPELRELHYEPTKEIRVALRHIGACRRLQRLGLAGASEVTDSEIGELASLQQLEKINLLMTGTTAGHWSRSPNSLVCGNSALNAPRLATRARNTWRTCGHCES